MAQLVHHFELDRLERQKEWSLYTAAIEEANNEGILEVESGPASLSKADEELLRKKIRAGQFKMAKDRQILQLAQAKVAKYNEALSFVRTQTGYDDLQEVVDLFNKYEEEKYEKMNAISRLVRALPCLKPRNIEASPPPPCLSLTPPKKQNKSAHNLAAARGD